MTKSKKDASAARNDLKVEPDGGTITLAEWKRQRNAKDRRDIHFVRSQPLGGGGGDAA